MDTKVPYKYLYVDDESDDKVKSFADSLSKDGVVVEYKDVREFNTDYIKKNLVNYDGILLDLRLDDTPNSSDFTASEFAQHIRTLVTKGDLTKDLPIVLFSTDEKLQKVYSIDLSSHNLFDGYIPKVNTPNNASKELFALAKGYIEIAEHKNNLEKLIGLENITSLNEEIFSRFLDEELTIPTHDYAQFILKDLIYMTGVLVDENILAARLGVDIDESEDWEKVQDIFKSAKYKGVFSDGWNRWWMNKVDELFEELAGNYLAELNAKEKVSIFKHKLNSEKIEFAKPIKHNSSLFYSTVCKAYKKPMDEMEGFRVYVSKEPKSWQEYEYFSLDAFLEGKLTEKNIKVHVADKENLKSAIEDVEQ